MIRIESRGNAVLVAVKVVPGSSRDRFVGEWNGRAKIAVAAPPEGGKANKAVETLLAKLTGARRRRVAVIRGHASHFKTVRIDEATIAAVRDALQPR